VRLLVVNWQDRENPFAGGAEIHLHEIFGRLAARGHDITLLCSAWAGAARRTTIDGISVHRVGSRYTFQFMARSYYHRVLASAGYDVLVEDINKVPLWTPRWGACQELPAPLAAAVWLQERPIGRVYGATAFEAISESTADDLAARGIPRERIAVIHPGIDTAAYTPAPAERSPVPLVAYLGRLKRYKRVDLIIRAFAAMRHPTAQLAIAGAGSHRPALERLAASLDLGDRVHFLGFISEPQKVALLRSAWVLAFTSPKEGWGITNLEAAACATPVVASSSPGLRESVLDGETGFLVPHGDLAALESALRRIVTDPSLVISLGEAGRRFASRFTWEAAAEQTEAHLECVAAARVA
jgi:glycosyltransferase involved in cell wall biosynthesis